MYQTKSSEEIGVQEQNLIEDGGKARSGTKKICQHSGRARSGKKNYALVLVEMRDFQFSYL